MKNLKILGILNIDFIKHFEMFVAEFARTHILNVKEQRIVH